MAHRPPLETHSEKNILRPHPQPHPAPDPAQTPQHPRSIDRRPNPDEGKLLLQKRGSKLAADGPASNLRSIIGDHEQDYKQSKPFQKKYGPSNPPAKTKTHEKPPSEEKEQGRPAREGRNKTRESFNKKLNSNIIKDEEQPSPVSKQSFRIKKLEKAETKSPKKLRDDIIALNEEEMKLQREILDTHQKYKAELERVQREYGLSAPAEKIGKYLPEEKGKQLPGEDDAEASEEYLEKVLEKVEEKLRLKRKELSKLQHKIEHNGYLQYLANLPADIEEMNSSEEEDIVEELPQPEQPRLNPNQGSYSQAMPSLKDKKHALNLRRTYEVFKEQPRSQSKPDHGEQQQREREQRVREDGENRVTINNRLKDLLLG